MTRVALLTEIPAPYRIPLFNALADRVDLRVLFLAESNPLRPYRLHEDELRFAWDVVPGVDVAMRDRWLLLNRGVTRRLRGSDALVVGGWNQPAFWTALAWARAASRPAYLWVESTLRDARPGAGGGVKRLLAKAAAGFVVPGRASEEYVRAFAPTAAVVHAPNAVDNALFASRVGDRAELRAALGLERACVLYVGRLAPEKGVGVLLRAAEGLDADVVIAGSGPEEQALRRLAPGARFLGNVERNDLPAWYAAADVLVLPSLSEPWGMPLNEGAAAGLPLVATDACGAAWELVVDRLRVPAGDVAALRDALAALIADSALRERAAARSRELAARFTPEAWADAVAGAVVA